jgi:transcription elongation factor Elf1
MIQTSTPPTARSRRETRRMVGLERHYRCGSCAAEHSSWARMSSCPDCGHEYVAAVIRRAAFA